MSGMAFRFFIAMTRQTLSRHGTFPTIKTITTMPINKNALLRYKTIDRCLRNRYRRWTLDDLVEACSDTLYEMEGITKGVSVRTIQSDLQIMRSDKLGYNAPIVVYEGKYYRYEDPDYSIEDSPIDDDTVSMIMKAVNLIRRKDENEIGEIEAVLDKIAVQLSAILLHQ